MEVDFDIDDFLSRISGNKPPFQCPVEECSIICKSFTSIRTHMAKHRPIQPIDSSGEEECNPDSVNSQDGSAVDQSTNSSRKKLDNRNSCSNLDDADKFVLFDFKGRNYRYNSKTPLEICDIPKSDKLKTLSDAKTETETPEKSSNVSSNNKTGPPKLKKSVSKPLKSHSSKPVAAPNKSKSKPELQVPEPKYEFDKDFPVPKKNLIHNEEGFIRFIDKTNEELEETIEYDLDEEDLIWLEKYNAMRLKTKLPPISQTIMESIMDGFEKCAHFRPSGGVDNLENVDEEAVCAVCLDGYCDNTNAILFCDVCNMAVHQECYGVPYIPEGQWLCRKCIYSPSEPVDCCMCPNRGGAVKKTSDDVHWAHVVCALWVPEVIFANLTFLEPIENTDKISQARRRLQCYICKQRNTGACIQCHKNSCYTAFHVTCAQQAGLYMRIEKCDSNLGGVKKSAYCHRHAPCDQNKANSSMYANSDNEEENLDKLHLRKTRKILADKRNSKPNVCVPVVPLNKYRMLVSELQVEDKEEFATRVHAFWKLKREIRHGVPLLKRLQASSNRGAINFVATDDESKRMRAQMKFWQRLRHDLEKARLLAELIRKRERMKRDIYRIYFMTVELKIQPFVCFLRKLVTRLQEKDVNQIFSEPVTDEIVPGYSDVIKHPMDFSTILEKVENHDYSNLKAVESDFHLMISNCCAFNPKNSIFYKSAVKLKDFGNGVFRSARELVESIKYDECTGLHLTDISHYIEENKEKEKKCYLDATDIQTLSKREKETLTPAKQLKFLVKKLESLLASKSDSNPNLNHKKKDEISQLEKQIKSFKSRYKIDSMPEKSPSAKLLKQISSSSSPIPSSNSSTLHFSTHQMDESNATSPARTELPNLNSPLPESKLDMDEQCHSSENRSNARNRPPRKLKVQESKTPSVAASDSSSVANAFSQMKPWWSKDKTSPLQPRKRGRPFKSTATPSAASSQSSVDQTEVTLKRRYSQTSLTSSVSKTSSKKKESPKKHKSPPKKIPKLFQNNCPSPADPPLMSLNESRESPPVSQLDQKSFTQYRSNLEEESALSRAASNHRTKLSLKNSADKSNNNSRITRRRLSTDISVQEKSSSETEIPASPQLRRRRQLSRQSSDKSSFNHCNNTRNGNRIRISDTTSSSNNSDPESASGCPSETVPSEGDDAASDELSVNLEALDVVWALRRAGHWFPAMIVDPNMPKDGYSHNGVPIAAPPAGVLKHKPDCDNQVFLVHLFDEDSKSWEWLTREKLEPLAVDLVLDSEKAKSFGKSKLFKSARVAYNTAIAHLRKITGRQFTEFENIFNQSC